MGNNVELFHFNLICLTILLSSESYILKFDIILHSIRGKAWKNTTEEIFLACHINIWLLFHLCKIVGRLELKTDHIKVTNDVRGLSCRRRLCLKQNQLLVDWLRVRIDVFPFRAIPPNMLESLHYGVANQSTFPIVPLRALAHGTKTILLKSSSTCLGLTLLTIGYLGRIILGIFVNCWTINWLFWNELNSYLSPFWNLFELNYS